MPPAADSRRHDLVFRKQEVGAGGFPQTPITEEIERKSEGNLYICEMQEVVLTQLPPAPQMVSRQDCGGNKMFDFNSLILYHSSKTWKKYGPDPPNLGNTQYSTTPRNGNRVNGNHLVICLMSFQKNRNSLTWVLVALTVCFK